MGTPQENMSQPSRRFPYVLLIALLLAGLVIAGFAFVMYSGTCYNLQNQLTNSQNQAPSNQSSQNIIIYQNTTSISDVYSKVKDSVVTVQGTVSAPSSTGQVQGSGFLYNYAGQIIVVTNFHVINNAKNIIITFDDGNAYSATVKGSDAYADLAVLQFENTPQGITTLNITSSSTLKVGDSVIAVGNPFGLTGSLSTGIVSQLGRTFSEPTAGGFMIANAIQIDAPINPGNSGGPLLDYTGNVVGITTAIVSDSQGLGLAIPSDTILKEIPSLISDGSYTQHSWLGISSTDMNYNIAQVMELNTTYGVIVAETTQDGPAQNAGIKGSTSQIQVAGRTHPIGGDVIVALNGTAIVNGDNLSSYLDAKTLPGDTLYLSIIRNKQESSIPVLLGTRPSPSI